REDVLVDRDHHRLDHPTLTQPPFHPNHAPARKRGAERDTPDLLELVPAHIPADLRPGRIRSSRPGRMMSPDEGITFPAWRGKHYVTLAELLVRRGSFGLDLTWRIEFDEIVDRRCVEDGETIRRRRHGHVDAVVADNPFLQLIDAEARGFAEDKLMLVLTEFDSSSWDVRAVDERVLSELCHPYPIAEDL
ncbi:hypothetical protein, partial [Streptomyces sp. NPDC056069]|uniref:hypothetical protein n=1 Tax=Streptomyces sp. NPDC056069 TaxID=3345702 RepID=UPI0035D6A383